jgi:histidinol-phosphate phosphatase family protein
VAMMQRPTQAVILAGGRGTRLGPLTLTRPKPMVEIQGRPFLEYQIEQLCEQGFKRVLLLLGYLPEVVRDYFGNGRPWGIKIEYSVSAVDDETGRRLKLAEPFLDPHFLLLYCDNYWPMAMDKMWAHFVTSRAPAMITVYSNKDGYTRNSVRVESDSFVSIYDKSCTHPDLNGVEVSYAILNREIVHQLSDANVLFETAVYPILAQRRQLTAFVTDHRYFSVGAPHRLPLTEDFFRRRKTVIVDRDGVLNRKPPRAEYVRTWEEFEWLPGALSALQLLHAADYRVVVVSNQAGIARGAMTDADLATIHQLMTGEVAAAGGNIEAIYYCPHDWEAGCECRKPKPGMLFQAQRDLNLDLSRTFFVGDDERDAAAADSAGCLFGKISNDKPLIDWVRELLEKGTPMNPSVSNDNRLDHSSPGSRSVPRKRAREKTFMTQKLKPLC